MSRAKNKVKILIEKNYIISSATCLISKLPNDIKKELAVYLLIDIKNAINIDILYKSCEHCKKTTTLNCLVCNNLVLWEQLWKTYISTNMPYPSDEQLNYNNKLNYKNKLNINKKMKIMRFKCMKMLEIYKMDVVSAHFKFYGNAVHLYDPDMKKIKHKYEILARHITAITALKNMVSNINSNPEDIYT